MTAGRGQVKEHRFHPPLDIVDGAAPSWIRFIAGIQHRRTCLGEISERLSADGLVNRLGLVRKFAAYLLIGCGCIWQFCPMNVVAFNGIPYHFW